MGNCCSHDYKMKDHEAAFHMNRDQDDEGRVDIVEDPGSQSRVLVVSKAKTRQKEMYILKEEYE